MNIYLDLETIPSRDIAVHKALADGITVPGNYSKPESIAKWEAEQKPGLVEEAILKTSFDGVYGSIVCAGIAFDDAPPKVVFFADWQDREADILQHLFALIEEEMPHARRRPRFIGHNLVGFDLRFLFKRAVILGVQPPAMIPFVAKPWDDTVFDTMVAWDAKNSISLGKLAGALKVGGKGGMDGSQVWPMVQSGKIEDVAAYCKNDIDLTRAVYKRMNFIV
jgi:predicted PolB exonuclease-like 3'-5' exonuclease